MQNYLNLKIFRTSSNEYGQYVKRFKCEECGAKFVQISTLEEHAVLHRPFPHVCHCGIGFYLKKDLGSHKNLVHSNEIKKDIAHLTFREKRAITNEMWIPKTSYKGPKIKATPVEDIDIKSDNTDSISDNSDSEEEIFSTRVRPRLRAQLVVKSKGKRIKKPKRLQKNKIPRAKPMVTPKIEPGNYVKNEDNTYTCCLCKKTVKTKASMQKHQLAHIGFRPYSCTFCDKKFTQKGALDLHIRRHNGLKPHACTYCVKAFVSAADLRLHIRTHTGEKPYVCSFCTKAFSDPSAWNRHERTHTGYKPYVCQYCPKTFSDKSGHIRHEKWHLNKRDFECKICLKRFRSKHEVKTHVIAVHNTVKAYECEICNKAFALKTYLHVHYNSHSHIKKFKCDYCGFACKSKSAIESHIESMHLKRKQFKCTECGVKFSAKRTLISHVNAVHKRLVKYECDQCDRKFPIKSYLTKHIMTFHHVGVKCETCKKPLSNDADLETHRITGCIQCDICGKYFMAKNKLQGHLASHSYRPNLPCEFCPKLFNTKEVLKKHLRQVHGEKKLECNDCGQRFTIKSYLVEHIFSKHLIKVSCSICLRQFNSGTDLERHKSKGSCTEKCICKICGKFTRSLTQHLTAVHAKIKSYFCDHCDSKFYYQASMVRHLKLSHKYLFRSKKNRPKKS